MLKLLATSRVGNDAIAMTFSAGAGGAISHFNGRRWGRMGFF